MIQAELIYAKKVTVEFSENFMERPSLSITVKNPKFMMAEHLIRAYEMGGPILIVVGRYNLRRDNLSVFVAVEDGTYKWWGNYSDQNNFRSSWEIMYEFRRVLIEKNDCYI